MSDKTVIHVIDDDQAMRESLAFLLDVNGYKPQTHESAAAFLNKSAAATPCCVVSDIRMPGMNGIELVRALKSQGSACPVILITGHGDVALAVEAMKAGAVDFLEKPFDDELLLRSVRLALNRSQENAERESERTELDARIATLTNRERDVLDGLVAGKPNKIIAFDLAISPRTVEIYRANLMTKMQAASLSELVRMALLGGVMKSGTNK